MIPEPGQDKIWIWEQTTQPYDVIARRPLADEAISCFRNMRLPLGREPFDASTLLSIDPELCRRVDELRVSSRVEKLKAERLR